jgi:hypothetical protein
VRTAAIVFVSVLVFVCVVVGFRLLTVWKMVQDVWGPLPPSVLTAEAARATGASLGQSGSTDDCVRNALTQSDRDGITAFTLACLDAANAPEACVEASYEQMYDPQQERIERFCRRLGLPLGEPCTTVAASVDVWCAAYRGSQRGTSGP